jgi:hypothetical protein
VFSLLYCSAARIDYEILFFIHIERSWRSLLKCFNPLLVFIDYSFIGRHANGILALLNDGGDRDPEVLEQVGLLSVVHNSFLQLSSRNLICSVVFQVFTSWSYIMMYLQKYLVKDIVQILRWVASLKMRSSYAIGSNLITWPLSSFALLWSYKTCICWYSSISHLTNCPFL